MKTVISIDFDIVMAPSIEQYNNLVPKLSWNDLKQLPYLSDLNYDKDIYNKLINYINLYPKEKRIFIKEHDEIIKYITEPCYLINVDHHHDCGYENNGDKVSCANWLNYLFINNLITDNPIWYCDRNSGLQHPDWIKVEYIEDKDIPMGDLLIVANSVPWIPPEYQFLFEALKTL